MGFYWVGIIFWGCTIVSLFLFLFSVMSRNSFWMMISGFSLTLPALYFLGSPSLWWIAIAPLIPFSLSFYMKKQTAKSD
ncbi:hypothetical protein [Bacillus sp. Marseille-Q3570]|uniref:hypothetical protein n=1 Tax=Bacillus sp. Marseille-Q3570 TaxID=2963522 RepID=UPI0021B74B0B|nr:hypothetical protein [Bacillus sp. Marseille-Q3570]